MAGEAPGDGAGEARLLLRRIGGRSRSNKNRWPNTSSGSSGKLRIPKQPLLGWFVVASCKLFCALTTSRHFCPTNGNPGTGSHLI